MKYDNPRVPESTQWIPVLYGCPKKQVKRVLARLSDGRVTLAVYCNRDKTWARESDNKILANVESWKLVDSSFDTYAI